MKQFATTAIVLSRVDYGEADRILTLLTPEYGKLHAIAKGVRRVKSKLAGGIELFSVSDITFVRGRGSVDTLISSRLIKHYEHIVESIQRVQLGYELIKLLNTLTEDEPGREYFVLLEQTFEALNDTSISTNLVRTWFFAQILRIGGHTPNLRTDSSGRDLQPGESYTFNIGTMSLTCLSSGGFSANHIKFLRLLFSNNQPKVLRLVEEQTELVQVCQPTIETMLSTLVQV